MRSRSVLVSLLFGPEDLLIAWNSGYHDILRMFPPTSQFNATFFSRMDKWLCTMIYIVFNLNDYIAERCQLYLRFWLVSSWPCVPLNVMIVGCIPVNILIQNIIGDLFLCSHQHQKAYFSSKKRADFIMFHPPIPFREGECGLLPEESSWGQPTCCFPGGWIRLHSGPGNSEPLGSVGTHGDEMAGAGSLTPKFKKRGRHLVLQMEC